jgi:hypothetical protein
MLTRPEAGESRNLASIPGRNRDYGFFFSPNRPKQVLGVHPASWPKENCGR